MSSTIDLGRVVGFSAYEIAVQNGFTGTQTEWLASLEAEEKFKGWYDTPSALNTAVASPTVGDYAYVKDASPATTVSIYACNTAGTWNDSGLDMDTANLHAYIPKAASMPPGGFEPNTLYVLGELTGSVTFLMASATNSAIANEWHWIFTTGSTAPTIVWPVQITVWCRATPIIRANYQYEISVVEGMGVCAEAVIE